MWPWEHLAVGYLAYSLLVRLHRGHPPRGRLAIAALALGTQFPDLVDKPLAWVFHVLPSGTSLAHSVFFAVPFVALIYGLAWALDRPWVGGAFGIGYLLHLPADVLYVALYGSQITWSVLLWPLYSTPADGQVGFFENVAYYFGNFSALFASEMGTTFLALEILLVGGVLALWILDGFPGLRGYEPPRHGAPSRN